MSDKKLFIMSIFDLAFENFHLIADKISYPERWTIDAYGTKANFVDYMFKDEEQTEKCFELAAKLKEMLL